MRLQTSNIYIYIYNFNNDKRPPFIVQREIHLLERKPMLEILDGMSNEKIL